MKLYDLYKFYISDEKNWIIAEFDNELELTKIIHIKQRENWMNKINENILKYIKKNAYEVVNAENHNYILMRTDLIDNTIEDYLFRKNQNLI